MKYNLQIIITKHAIERYMDRCPHSIDTGSTEENMRIAERYLQELWSNARYIADDANGILFRADGVDMIVKGKKMVTVMSQNSKRKRFRKEINGNKEGNHIPSILKNKI